MAFTRLASLSLASSLLLAGAATTALAQDPAPAPAPSQEAPAPEAPAQDSQAAAEAQTASGTLTKVDADNKTLSVKGADGAELTFSYTADTEITGDKTGEQGLATAEGSMVTVHYTEKDGAKTASKIEVKPAAQQ